MKISVSQPYVGKNDKAFLNDALESNAISGVFGKYLGQFEEEFAEFCGVSHAISCSSGTAALHLALAAAGIKEGDEVLVPSLTNMATFFAVLYTGAQPIPVDVSLKTLTIDSEDLSRKITKKSKAILLVHLFGHPADMDPINELAKQYNLKVFEDCAEAHGATYKGSRVGGLGEAGCFSFFANKIVSTGEGGMVTTNNPKLAERVRNMKALAFGDSNKFMHKDIGFNYRMTNLQAAIGCGQMTVIDKLVEKRREIGKYYTNRFKNYTQFLQLPEEMSWAKNVIWMYHIVLRDQLTDKRDLIMSALKKEGIETREGFIPFHLQEIFLQRGWTNKDDCPNSTAVSYSSFYLPTSFSITENELDYVSTKFISIIDDVVK